MKGFVPTHVEEDENSRIATDGCVTVVDVQIGGEHGRGVARCSPHDEFDPVIGAQIAMGRALEKVGRRMAEAGKAKATRNCELRADDLVDVELIGPSGQKVYGVMRRREANVLGEMVCLIGGDVYETPDA